MCILQSRRLRPEATQKTGVVREAGAWSGDNSRSVLLKAQLAGQTWQFRYRHDEQSQP